MATKGPRGAGTLNRIRLHGRWTYQADFIDETGKRVRKVLGPNRVQAAARFREIVERRDRVLSGLERQDSAVTLGDVVGPYLDDLATRRRARHVARTRQALDRVVAAL